MTAKEKAADLKAKHGQAIAEIVADEVLNALGEFTTSVQKDWQRMFWSDVKKHLLNASKKDQATGRLSDEVFE